MVVRERLVLGRMPVLGAHEDTEQRRDPIDQRHHLMRGLDRQSAAGAEVVLHVDDDQRGAAR